MLDVNRTRVISSSMMALSSTVASIEEGTLLVSVLESGKAVVKPAAGSSSEILVGVARSQILNPTTAPRVEIVTVPSSSPYTVTLARTPLDPDTNVGASFVATGGALVVDTTPDATADFFIVGNVATFHSSDAGKKVKLTYRYSLTVAEAQMLYGQGIGDAAQSIINATEVITQAQVLYTDKYDLTSNWEAGGPVYSGAGGIFTLATSGKKIENCIIVETPQAGGGQMPGMLGLKFIL